MQEYAMYAKHVVGMLAIMNPIGIIPIFLSMKGERTAEECNKIALTTAVSVATILLVSTWVGTQVLDFFGINLPAFRTGGGILILLMALAMLNAKLGHIRQAPGEADEASAKDSIAVVPLAIPLLAGPGAISLAISNAHQTTSAVDKLILSVGVVLIAFFVWLALRLAVPIGKFLGTTGLNIATRIMGLLLAAIGIQMLTAGLVKLLPGLA
jgi:MarC family membrane protein